MVLTVKQRSDLHKAIFDYLRANPETFTSACLEAFQTDASIQDDGGSATAVSGTPILEKKWTSIVRLQKKILTLESQVGQLQQQLKTSAKGGASLMGDRAVSGSYSVDTSPRFTIAGHRAPIVALAFHPVYNLMVSTSDDATVKVWDYETGEFERTLKGHSNTVQDATFSADGALLATCSSDLSIKLWDFKTFECVRTLMGHDHNVSGVAFLPQGDKLVSCSRDKSIKVWEVATGFCVSNLLGHTDWVRKIAVQPGSNDVIASCSNDQSLAVWNVSTGARISDMRGHEHVVECLAFSSPEADKHIRRGRQSTANAATTAPGESSASKSTGGEYLVSGSRDRTVRVWHVQSGGLLHTLTGHDNWVRGVTFQPLGKFIISVGEDKTIRVWDLQQERNTRTISGAHDHFLTCIAVHPKQALVATGSVDTSVRLWLGV